MKLSQSKGFRWTLCKMNYQLAAVSTLPEANQKTLPKLQTQKTLPPI